MRKSAKMQKHFRYSSAMQCDSNFDSIFASHLHFTLFRTFPHFSHFCTFFAYIAHFSRTSHNFFGEISTKRWKKCENVKKWENVQCECEMQMQCENSAIQCNELLQKVRMRMQCKNVFVLPSLVVTGSTPALGIFFLALGSFL
jgi:hypothetical protein